MTKSIFTNRGNDTWIAEIACAIVFCIFTFAYLFFYQADLLTMEQHVLSDGLTKYNRTIGAVIITAILLLLQQGVDAATKRTIKMPALTYFPPAMLLAMLTDISPSIDHGYSIGKWAWLAPLLLTAWGVAAYASARHKDSDSPKQKTIVQTIWENILAMTALYIFIGATANTDRVFHERMKMEVMVAEGKYKDALNVKTSKADKDSTITMLRAYALAREGKMGERLFEYRVYGGSEALLPNGTTVKSLLLPRYEIFRFVAKPAVEKMGVTKYLKWMKKHRYAKKPLRDYLLCAYLMDRKIDLFVKELVDDKETEFEKLPKHYREALILYNHIRSNPMVSYHNDIMDTDYTDMQNILRSVTNKKEAMSMAGKSYGNTYWYYYFSGK